MKLNKRLTPLQLQANKTTALNQYRKEAERLYNIYSPTRQGWYMTARLQGSTPEQAAMKARIKSGKTS